MKRLAIFILLTGLGACSGGSGDSGSNSSTSSFTAGQFASSSTFAQHCATPRTGASAVTGVAYRDTKGTTLDENNYLRSWTNELYLWYREVPDQNPASFTTTASYFDILKTSATTPSGAAKDKFHFTYPTPQWEALSQGGVEAGYGAQWVLVSASPPRLVVVAYTEPNTPATAASVNLARGAQVLTVDGVDLVNAGDATSVATLNAGLFPSAAGGSHTFSVLDRGASTPRTVTMVAANVTSTPVQNVSTIKTSSGTVGYMLFNDHIATAEPLLISAFSQLSSAGVTDLVLDIRYNGGGYLDIAGEVAYMIAGPGATAGQTFEKPQFNDKYPNTNPVTGASLTPVTFHNTSQGFSGPQGQALPALNLSRVFVLTSSNTCSASEAIMNGLRGVNVQVIQIGSTTCGKPYGFYPAENCGTTYFSIQFRGINAQGFGEYPDGFSPANTVTRPGVTLPGCSVADDFTRALGDPSEGRLAAALGYRANQSCPGASGNEGPGTLRAPQETEGRVFKSPWRENRIMR